MSKEQQLKKIAEKFRDDMTKMGLGVTIHIDGEKPVVIVPPPECDGSRTCKAEHHIQGCFRSSREAS